ncbi:HPr-rel-A system PqqD family peptide chaperone [Govanella unica]|uniref:HPr-rel-A system PqqD family peptide chaperone n=1 Tax=Govanella unica TaxID=2975056 RepID=A0A9X3TXQ0_9PROT|nr:HPr-rel-A system PqqD family peptide chaperone [Govania unica]MDA5193619.1 HPr-rel-A system PqqD family peptide chaperone [Govania unica]
MSGEALRDVLWAGAGASGFLWREFGSFSVLYDPRSGETHLLDPLAREILDLFIEQPRTETEVVAQLAELLGSEGGDIASRVAEAIAEFDRLGLIFPGVLQKPDCY